MSTRKVVDLQTRRDHNHMPEDIPWKQSAHIANAATDVAACGAAYSQAEVNAIVTALNALAVKYNALLVILEENGLIAES